MPGFLDLIQRPPVFHRVAAASRLPGAATNPLVDDMITRLTGNPALPDNRLAKIALDMGFYADQAAMVHFTRDWLNDPPGGGFWPAIDVEGILRTALAVALQKFKDTALPLEFFWVTSGDQNTDRWEASITVCKTIVAVVFHTPLVPCFVETQESTTMTIVRRESGTIVARPVLEPKPPLMAITPNVPVGALARRKIPRPKPVKPIPRKPPRGPKKRR